MATLNLLLLGNEATDHLQIQKVMTHAGFSVKIKLVYDRNGFVSAIASDVFDAILIYHPTAKFKAKDALTLLNKNRVNAAVVVIAEKITQNYLTRLVMEGAHDYILHESIERLPIAIMNAIEKIGLKAEQEKFFDELITRKTLMRDAERLARFGSWREDHINDTVYWSDEKFRILGYEPGEVVPSWENFLRRIHPDDVELVEQTTEETKQSKNRQKYTFRIQDKNEQTKYIHCEIFITRDAHLNVTQLNGFIRDISDHTEAEIKLVASEEKYRTLFENSPCALFVVETLTGKFLDVNRVATEQLGYCREEFLGMSIGAIYHPDERKRLEEYDNNPADNIGNTEVWRYIRKNGTVIFVEISTSDIIFEGKLCHLVLTSDVTEKREALNRVRESEARLITSQRIAHIGSWELDLTGDPENKTPVNWTDEAYRIFGFEPDEVEPGKMELSSGFFLEMVHPDDKTAVIDALDKAIRDKSEFSVEFRIIRADGTERILSELAEVIFDEKTGRQLKITGTVKDITERKQAAKMLQKSEANLRSIFENTEMVYVLLDLELKVVSFNSAASRFSDEHLQKRIIEGTESPDYFPKEMRVLLRKSLKKALAGGSLNYEVSFPERNGIPKWYNAHFHPVRADDQRVLGVIMSLRDITEQKASELQEKKITSELIQRNKDLEQFAYIISHNLRAQVANILGVSDALNDSDLDDSEREFFMEGLRTSVKKLDNVITDLNRILQMKNEVNENKEVVRFSQLVNDIKFSLADITKKEHFQIKTDFSAEDEMLTLKSYIHSIFYNLISNSLKYKQPDLIPVIEITSRKAGDKLILTFKDNGLGIDLKKNSELIFGLYKRFHLQTAEGKGMGLFMVKSQVQTLGGKISVESEVNKGTTFTIEFELPPISD